MYQLEVSVAFLAAVRVVGRPLRANIDISERVFYFYNYYYYYHS